MKKIYIAAVLCLCFQVMKAQQICGSEINLEELERQSPTLYQSFQMLENEVLKFRSSRSTKNGKIVIPVVVHVLHNGENVGTGLNISNAQIQSQIDVLNEDFNRMNANKINTPAIFSNVAADIELEFRLANRNPAGEDTNGIIRRRAGRSVYNIEANGNIINEVATGIKFNNLGSVAWDTERYLNIWVCNLGRGLLGYAQFPFLYADSPNTDGVVIRTTSFGRIGNVVAPFDKGRIATHEVGHWLNLFHIWGDKQGCNHGTDYCDDTPDQFNLNRDCSQQHHSCSSTGDMFMNYMDYTNDDCRNLFTIDQKTRMRSLFENGGVRESIKISGRLMFAEISGPTTPCTQAEYKIENLPAGATVKWSSSDNVLKLASGQGTAKALFKQTGFGKSEMP